MRLAFVTIQILFTAFCFLPPARGAASSTGVKCIVIDAGHGGKDPGAVGNGIREKDITLAVALLLGKKIEQGLPGVKVVYTRRDDRFLELAERSKVAAAAGGDLFISIHVNAAANSKAEGTETFVMGVDKGNQNLEVVMRENAVISLEADYTSRYEGYDPNSAESVIMFSLMQYAYQSQSLNLADLVQKQYVSQVKTRNRGVKQAGFLVLWRTPMPSILTEVGFISNAEEAKFMKSAAGQEKIATALFNAVAEYKKQTERVTLATGSGAPPKAEPAPKQPEPVVTGPVADPAPEESADKSRRSRNNRNTGPRTVPAGPVGKTPEPAAQPGGSNHSGASAVPDKTQGMSARNVDSVVSAPPAEKNSSGVVFRIQVKSSLTPLTVNAYNFGNYAGKVTELKIDGRYKYFCESSFSYKEALILQRKVRESFPDAFMVAFRDGRPVPLAQVIR